MNNYSQPLILMSLGMPGAGKSYFMRSLAERLRTIRINSDSMRRSIFGSVENIDSVKREQGRQVLLDYTLRALDYVAEQVVCRGYDLIYDAQFNSAKDRAGLRALAERNGAVAIVVHVDTPLEVALARGQSRETTHDQRRQDKHNMREIIERHLQSVEMPGKDEKVITVDGQQPFEQQFVSFDRQLKAIL